MNALFASNLSTRQPNFPDAFAALIDARTSVCGPNRRQAVADILDTVQRRGDAGLLEATREYDRHEPQSVAELAISAADFEAAFESLDSQLRDALQAAAERVRDYARHLTLDSFEYADADGSRLGQRVQPLQRVGIYVPGGTAAYPSSVLMNAIPARVAGVQEVLMVSPTPKGQSNPIVLAAAHVAGVDRGWALGGAQAIGALAYGTESIPAVDKVVGPGNAWVVEAKRQVFGVVGIDTPAGPSEIVIVSDGSADPRWLASDLMAQAEHDTEAQACLISPDAAHLESVAAELATQLDMMPRREIIRASLKNYGVLIQTESIDEAITLVNRMAPEHLQLALRDPRSVLDQVQHAGAIFLGARSAEVMGDYCAGPNHVLPTARTARFASPLGSYDFQKRSSVIELSESGASALAGLAACLAEAEGLGAHAVSARWRGVDHDNT